MPLIGYEIEEEGYLLSTIDAKYVIEPGNFFIWASPPLIVNLPEIFDFSYVHPPSIGA
tara:strand:+ start:254 stop:427 length:174 start_codon:yes stop_codon:yes gene_type:complete